MKMRYSLILVLATATLVSGCTSVSVDSDFDHDIDFSKYKTFAWYNHSESRYKPQQANQIVDARIHRAIASELLAKGFTQTAPDKADLLITYFTSTERKIDVYHSGYGYGYGHWGGYWGPYGGYPTASVSQYDVGTLVLDFIDRKKNDLVWRGMIQKALSGSDSSEGKINKHAARLLSGFPPGVRK